MRLKDPIVRPGAGHLSFTTTAAKRNALQTATNRPIIECGTLVSARLRRVQLKSARRAPDLTPLHDLWPSCPWASGSPEDLRRTGERLERWLDAR